MKIERGKTFSIKFFKRNSFKDIEINVDSWLVENMKSEISEFYIQIKYQERIIKSEIIDGGKLGQLTGTMLSFNNCTEQIEAETLWNFPPTKLGLTYMLVGITGITSYEELNNLIEGKDDN